MLSIPLTDAQFSALECSGVTYPQTEAERLLAARWVGSRLVFEPSERDTIVSALISLCNCEDDVAEDASRDEDERRGARGARQALSNLIAKI